MAGRKAPPPPSTPARGKGAGRTKKDPNSARQKRLAEMTGDRMQDRAREFRDRFIEEYIIDFNGVEAYYRAGGTAESRKKAADYAANMKSEPYVAKRLQEIIDEAAEARLINRNRVLAGFNREANYFGPGAQHGARVAAYGKLATVLGMDSKRIEQNLASRGGILIVPATEKMDDWEKRSAAAQQALKEDVRK